VQIDPGLNREDLAKVAHGLGEVVGLGLRNVAHCPVELNLMPKSSLKRQEFNQKKPFLIAAVFCLITIIFAFGYFNDKVAKEKQNALEALEKQLRPLQSDEQALDRAMRDLRQAEDEASQYAIWMEERFYWAGMLAQVRQVLQTIETKKEEDLKVKTGFWVDSLIPITCGATNAPAGAASPAPASGAAARGRGRQASSQAGGPAQKEICSVTLKCRGKNLKDAGPEVNGQAAYAVFDALKNADYFDPAGVVLSPSITEEADGLTFMFELNCRLRRPIKF
jgi:hypothetical protein